MSEDDRTYTDEEFALVLRKAAELARESDSSSRPGDGLSLDDMKAIAAEAGLDPMLIERAARLIPSESGGSLLGWVQGRPLTRRLSASFPTPLTQETTSRVLSVIRARSGRNGAGGATSSALTWSAGSGGVVVTMNDEAGASRVRVSVNPSAALGVAAWFGIVSGWIFVGILGPDTLGEFIGGIVGGLGVALACGALFTSIVGKRADAMMEAIAHTMAELDAGPRASEE